MARPSLSNRSSGLFPQPAQPVPPSPGGRKGSASSIGARRRSSTTSSVGLWSPAFGAGGDGGWEKDVPVIWEKESAEDWLKKLLEVVPRCEVATVLASSCVFFVFVFSLFLLVFCILLPNKIILIDCLWAGFVCENGNVGVSERMSFIPPL